MEGPALAPAKRENGSRGPKPAATGDASPRAEALTVYAASSPSPPLSRAASRGVDGSLAIRP